MAQFEIDEEVDLDGYLRSEESSEAPKDPSAQELPKVAPSLPKLTKTSVRVDASASVRLESLELPNGYKIDPEEWGLDVDYAAASSKSSFTVDLSDDEPAHLVEMPDELREFLNSDEAKNLSPEQLKQIVGTALQEEAQKAWAKFKAGAAAPVVAAIKPRDRHHAIIRGTVAAAVLLFVLLFSVKTAVVLALVGCLAVAGWYFWKRFEQENPGNQVSLLLGKAGEAVRSLTAEKPAELPPVESPGSDAPEA
jgi:membrane protein implicated in regulation of membrane protease activity